MLQDLKNQRPLGLDFKKWKRKSPKLSLEDQLALRGPVKDVGGWAWFFEQEMMQSSFYLLKQQQQQQKLC